MARKTVTLYFTPESELTDEDVAAMDALPGARHRNASLVNSEAPLEDADYVAGPAVPEAYAEAYPAPGGQKRGKAAADPHRFTKAQLMQALDAKQVKYETDANKEALVALYVEHVQDAE